MKIDKLGDRVKAFEQAVEFSGLSLQGEYICIRLDGNNFSRYTKQVSKPFDARLTKAMITTMNSLVHFAGARLAYTQSDEITLFIDKPSNPSAEVIFGGKVQKLVSLLASHASVVFNHTVSQTLPELLGKQAIFDCRVWAVPTIVDVADTFKWRMQDCIRNSVSMASHYIVGHSESLNKNTDEKIAQLAAAGIDWHQYPDSFKFGIFAEKKAETIPIPDELKQYRSNLGKETYVRQYVDNYSLQQLDDIYFTLNAQNIRVENR